LIGSNHINLFNRQEKLRNTTPGSIKQPFHSILAQNDLFKDI